MKWNREMSATTITHTHNSGDWKLTRDRGPRHGEHPWGVYRLVTQHSHWPDGRKIPEKSFWIIVRTGALDHHNLARARKVAEACIQENQRLKEVQRLRKENPALDLFLTERRINTADWGDCPHCKE